MKSISGCNFDVDVAAGAAERWKLLSRAMERKQVAKGDKSYSELDSPDRLVKRANHLIRKMKARMEGATEISEAAEKLLPELEAIGNEALGQGALDDETFERIIGPTRDFLSISFFDDGKRASRAVCKLVTKGGGQATGFLVSSRLLLTNHHVLGSAAVAGRTTALFNFQIGRKSETPAVVEFDLVPNEFFINDKDHDFALVAVAPRSSSGIDLKSFGYCPLIAVEGKIIPGEPVNIIQHPGGRPKEIVIRDNELLDLPEKRDKQPDLDRYALYKADTEPGSSGSPVFNDQWEVVALHHSGVPKTNSKGEYVDKDNKVFQPRVSPERIVWIGNEGIRVSRLMAFIKKADIRSAWRPLRDDLFRAGEESESLNGEVDDGKRSSYVDPSKNGGGVGGGISQPRRVELSGVNGTSFDMSIPLTITVSVGAATQVTQVRGGGADGVAVRKSGSAGEEDDFFVENSKPAEDYEKRKGFDTDFLGFEVGMPKLDNRISKLASRLDDRSTELKYNHYSVIVNSKRRLAFVSAVNVDGKARFKAKRGGGDRWYFDPRIPKEHQAGNELYGDNPLDRGHLTRRDDAAWGRSEKEAKAANDDTFHFTNCSPQHEVFNQSTKADQRGLKLWGSIENHIAAEAAREGRLCVFNGPVFRDDDPVHRGVQVPREFWKVVVCAGDDGKPRAFAFKLSQAGLIKNLPEEEFEVGAYGPYQVKLADLERDLRMDFASLYKADPLEVEGNESTLDDGVAVTLTSLGDIVL